MHYERDRGLVTAKKFSRAARRVGESFSMMCRNAFPPIESADRDPIQKVCELLG